MAKLSRRELARLKQDTLSTGDFLENLSDMLAHHEGTSKLLMEAAQECWSLVYTAEGQGPRLEDCEDFG